MSTEWTECFPFPRSQNVNKKNTKETLRKNKRNNKRNKAGTVTLNSQQKAETGLVSYKFGNQILPFDFSWAWVTTTG